MTRSVLCLLPALVALTGCLRQPDGQGLTGTEAAQTKDELQVASTSQAMVTKTIEITTNFTIGQAVQNAAQELKSFMQSQWACANTQISGNTITIQYGVNGSCPFNGYQSITGTQTITITQNDTTEVIVDHTWTKLSNGQVELDGTAHVTWNLADPSRHVQHDVTWTHLATGRIGHGTGDRIQKPLNGDLSVGFTESGERTWDTKLVDGTSRHWHLVIDSLEMRWQDPLPQAGSLTLDTPWDKTIMATFSRVDANTIHLELSAPKGSIGFDVSTP